jgi:formamidopyrimidine-DNA glycosylase
MPELPETETIARDLQARVRGSSVREVTVLREDVLRGATARELAAHVTGCTIAAVWRRAKLIVIDLEAPSSSGAGDRGNATTLAGHLVVQPRFTGSLLVDDGTLPDGLADYLTVTFTLHDGRALHYRDVRRLGTVSWMDRERFAAFEQALGPEPLGDTFAATDLRAALGDSSRVIKAALMDQHRLAGVGNIYATEALWAAEIDPSRETRTLAAGEWEALHAALQRILTASIAARGTSFRDYRDASGERGDFVRQLQAYGREAEPCMRCGRRLIATHAIDGRNTVFCATCQR